MPTNHSNHVGHKDHEKTSTNSTSSTTSAIAAAAVKKEVAATSAINHAHAAGHSCCHSGTHTSSSGVTHLLGDSSATTPPVYDKLRLVELVVLALVVISNVYFGYVLSARGVSAANGAKKTNTTSTSSSPTTNSQSTPAAVPKMVGGC